MFFVLNREVKPLIYTLVWAVLLVGVNRNHAHGHDSYDSNKKNPRGNTRYVSYESYMKERSADDQKEGKSSKNSTRKPLQLQHNDNHKRTETKKKFICYAVHRGDTLTRISKKYNVPVHEICAYNNLKNEHYLKKGMKIKIPLMHKISKKESNGSISEKNKFDKDIKPQFMWPLPHIVEYKQDEYNGVRPIGIIIVGKPGSPVFSSAPGVVKKIGKMRGFGKYIVIHHSGRYATVYANLNEITVSEGKQILGRDVIGKINSTDTKLHFQIDYEGKPQNPLKYLPEHI